MDQSDEVFGNYNIATISEEDMELKRGPWTLEEDFTLIDYVNRNGEGRWNSLARSAGLNRTGKSCRLRWLNYLRPNLRRGNITLEEQLLILELHCRWGNRWSKIAQHLPGRTDNEIKNYWRTRVQKHAKQLKCDVNSKQFKDTMRHVWIPRLVEKIQASASSRSGESSGATTIATSDTNSSAINYQNFTNIGMISAQIVPPQHNVSCRPRDHTSDSSSGSFGTSASEVTDCLNNYTFNQGNNIQDNNAAPENFCYGPLSPIRDFNQGLDFTEMNGQWMNGGDFPGTFWDVDDMWFLQE